MTLFSMARPAASRAWRRLIGRNAALLPQTEPSTQTGPRADRGRLMVSGLVLAVMGAALLLASLFLLSGVADERGHLLVADLLPPLLDVAAAGLVLYAARRATTRRAAVAWTTVGIATMVYGFGDALFAWFEIGLSEVPFPSLADVAYVAYYPIVVVALFSFPTVPANRAERIRLAIDSAIVVIGGGMLVWQSVFRATLESLGSDPVASLLSIGYPVGDLVLLFGVAAVALRRPDGVNPRALSALVGGLFMVLLADIGYAQLGLEGGEAWQGWTDVLYMGSTVAIAAAGFLQARSRPVPVGDGEREVFPAPLLYLPYLALAAGYGTLLLTARDVGATGPIELMLGAVLLTVIVLARQELVLRENSRLQAQQARRQSEARFRSLAGNSSDAIALVDPAGIVADATDAVRRVLGLDASALIGRSIVRLAHAEDAQRLVGLIDDAVARRPATKALEWRLWDGNGVWRQVETIAANLIDDPAIGHIVLTTRDVQERKVLQQRLRQVALHDVLTGLPNRTLFLDRVDHALAGGTRRGSGTVVLAVNIDGFKRFNDSLGHPAGDRVLQEVAARLGTTLRAADTCARIGGDEFGILLDGPSTAEDGRAAADRFMAALREPFALPDATVHVAVRIGIAVADSSNGGSGSVLRSAGVAMAHAHTGGRDGVAVFEPTMQQQLDGRFELEADLRLAIDRDELMLQYQPIVDLATGELVAAEALVRWDHPTRGRLAPNVFIPLAEETGLIDQVGSWVLRAACVEVAHWARISHSRVPRVSINLSPHQVADPNLPWTIQAALGQAGAVPAWISLEVTEGLLMENTGAILERLHAIRSLGISIAIDDFGTGFSSLAYLQQFPMSQIKIDRSFVTPLDDPSLEPGVVRAVVEIGRALGMSTIAEGIETATQLDRLRALGCGFGQGFLLDRPLDPEQIRDRIANPVPADWTAPGSRPALVRHRAVKPAAS
jgi:diguanylate cyclase (GGDEF)-like protein/PAS domain S-box-containing protein